MTILGLLVAARSASAAVPIADLGTGTYICEPFSTEVAGPDTLFVKASRPITPDSAFAFPEDASEITPTTEQGTNIIAANATGRAAGMQVLYVVRGKFVVEGGGQRQGGKRPTWEADYRPDNVGSVLLALKDANTCAGQFDSEGGVPNRVFCKAMVDGKGDVEFWLTLTQDSGTYSWDIKQGETSKGSGYLAYAEHPTSGKKYWDSKGDLSVGLYTLKVTKGESFEREIEFAIVSVDLFKKNETWTSDWVISFPALFTRDRIAGIEIKGPGDGEGMSVQVELYTDYDTENKVTTPYLTEDPPDVRRNSGTDSWPKFHLEYDESEKRLKVVDEWEKLHVIPIINGVKQEHLEATGQVDLAEVAAMDATPTDDAKAFYDGMTAHASGDPCWAGVAKAVWSIEADRPHITDDNCVACGKKADIFYLAGHGYTTAAAIGGKNMADHPLGDVANLNGKEFTPEDIGGDWNNGELEWCVFAACSQLYIEDGGNPKVGDNLIAWIKAMPKVHALFGYSYTAPGGDEEPDVTIANRFVAYTKTKTFVDAWMEANLNQPEKAGFKAVAMVQKECTEGNADKWKSATAFPTADGAAVEYELYWINPDKNGDGTKNDPEIQHYSITVP